MNAGSEAGDATADLERLTAELVDCRRCPRLVAWRERIGREKRAAFADQDYWARPVPGFGDPRAHLVVVGLAPAAHGANRTGRMFTGDRSGDFLSCTPRCTAPGSRRSRRLVRAATGWS